MAPEIHYVNQTCHKERKVHNDTTYDVDEHGNISVSSRSISHTSVKAGRTKSRSPSKEMKSPMKKRQPSKSPSMKSSDKKRMSSAGMKSQDSNCCCKPSSKMPKKRMESRKSRSEMCYDQSRQKKADSCDRKIIWQHGEYARDECGSGIKPKKFDFLQSRKLWCKTPLTMYQATIGDLGRQILCREKIVPRDVRPIPPCAVSEYVLPPCHGYYRKYDCLRPCEKEYAVKKHNMIQYRDRVQRYWEPCLSKDQKIHLDVNTYAGPNAFLSQKMLRRNQDMNPYEKCW